MANYRDLIILFAWLGFSFWILRDRRARNPLRQYRQVRNALARATRNHHG